MASAAAAATWAEHCYCRGHSANVTSMPVDELGMQVGVQRVQKPYKVLLNEA